MNWPSENFRANHVCRILGERLNSALPPRADDYPTGTQPASAEDDPMSDPNNDKDRTDWSAVNQVVQRRTTDDILPVTPAELEPSRSGISNPETGGPAQANGIVARYKANAITRKATLEYLSAYYTEQLEVARHHLSEVARVRKAGSTAVAEQLLASINSQQMQFLIEVGLRNQGTRNQAVVALGNQTSVALKQVMESDWPQNLMDQALNGILESQRKFFDRLMKDLGEE
jgi:hypothetical protein